MSKHTIAELRRFANFARRESEQRGGGFMFTADKSAGVLVVTVFEDTAPEQAKELRRLVKSWNGRVFEDVP